jgi:hypothetical protein
VGKLVAITKTGLSDCRHLGTAARTITKMAPRTASGSSGQPSINSCKVASIASDFAAPAAGDLHKPLVE